MTRRTPYVATFDEGREDINIDAAAGDISEGKTTKKGFVKRILNKALSKDNVNYMIFFSRLSCDPRQSFGTELTKRRIATSDALASVGSSAYVKCIQTNMGDLGGVFGNKAKELIMTAQVASQTLANITTERDADSIRSGEVVDIYKLNKTYTLANDVLSVHITRSIDEKGGLLVIKLDNKNGKYNDMFVRGDSIDVRVGYGGIVTKGTDYELQNIWLGTISSVLVEIGEDGETITIHGIDYFNVLKDKSMRNILIDKAPSTRRTTHDVKSLLSSFGRTMTDEFGHTRVPMYYKTIGSQIVGTPEAVGKFDVFENLSDTELYYPDARYRNLITEQSVSRLNLMTESPLLDDNVWDFFQGIFEEKGLYMRLKKSSIRGAGFRRGSPQLILAPKNMLTSEVRRVVDRWDDPHSFSLHDVLSTVQGTDDIINSMRVYEDSLNIKNRILITAQIPIIVQTTVREQDSERTRTRKVVKIKSIVIDSNHLLFPEWYHDWAKRTKDRNVSIRPSTVGGIKSYKIKYHLEDGDPPQILNFSEYLYDKILGRQQRLSDIPIQVRPEKTVTLKNMIEASQRFHGERTKHIYFDGVALINNLYGTQVGQAASDANISTREVGKTFSRPLEREVVLNRNDPKINYDVIRDAILREVIQTLVEHLHAVKGSVTLSKGNPSIDLFDCCKITDKRELKIGGGDFIEDSQFTKDNNLLKKVKGTAHKLGLKLPPTRSIGALFREFRISNKDLGGDAATLGVRRPDGGIAQKSLKTIQQLVYLGLQPRRRYIVHRITHNIDSNGFSTSVYFTLLPQFSSSNAVQKEVMQALHSHRVDNADLAEVTLTKRNQLLMGEVTKLINSDGDKAKIVHDYLKFTRTYYADGGNFDGSPQRAIRGKKNLHFDRVLVSVSMGDGGRATIPATVLRQKGIYTPPKIGDRVIVAKFIRTNEPLVYADWVVLGVFESDAALQTPSIIPLLFDGERGFTNKDIYLDKDYKTGFSNAVDLVEQQRQQAIIISNNDIYTEVDKPTQKGAPYSTEIDKPEQSTKVAIESISKRTSKTGTTSRRQKASINLNTNQSIGSITNDNSGESLIELATYEVDPSTGFAKTTQPFSYIIINRNNNNQAEINMVTKDGGSIQSQLFLNDDGVITAITKNLYLQGTDMTIIGNDSDSDTEILALNEDDILMTSDLRNALTKIANALGALMAVTALIAPASSPVPCIAPIAGTQIGEALQAILTVINTPTAQGSLGKAGEIQVDNATRKIKGKS